MNAIKPIARTKDTVTLSRVDYEAMVAAIEDAEDRDVILEAQERERRFGKRKARADYMAGDLVVRLLEGESPVRIWREHRGLTLEQLAKKASKFGATIGKSYLSQIETRRKPGSLAIMRALARALRVDLGDIAGGTTAPRVSRSRSKNAA